MDTKTFIKANNNLIEWHCATFCEYVHFLHSNIESLEAECLAANERIAALETELKTKNGIISDLAGKLRAFAAEKFAPSSEKECYQGKRADKDVKDNGISGESKPPEPIDINEERKKRGGRPGHKGYGRKIPESLPIEEVVIEIEEDKRCCKICEKGYRHTTMTEDSSKIDVKITVQRTIYKRAVYVKDCNCEESPNFLTAPKPEGIIPKSLYTNPFWCLLLVLKYFFQIPVNRQIRIIDMYNYEPNASTIIGGFKKLLPLLLPLYEKLKAEILKGNHWHGDETRWLVFEEKAAKKTHLWWLWTFVSERITAFVLDPTRSSNVPEKFFGKNVKGIINVDRYGAYNILKGLMLLAYCWYHLRRDFLEAKVSFPELSVWAEGWVEEIRKTEALNGKRLLCEKDSTEFEESHRELTEQLNGMKEKVEEQLTGDNLLKKQKTILKSMNRKWDGYTVFVDNPHVPMHNNVAENALRSGAVGRNNYYGSQVQWSGELAAIAMSIFQTAEKNGIMPIKYLEYYFEACQKNGGKPPGDMDMMLPWNAKKYILKSDDLEIKSG